MIPDHHEKFKVDTVRVLVFHLNKALISSERCHPMTEVEEMLKFIGVDSDERLFSDIPAEFRKRDFRIPLHLSEYEILGEADSIRRMNDHYGYHNFLGCGTYDRIVPASVDSIISRTEFLTSYTPYQAEISQGVLQSLFEYQSIISDLMGMDATNSSMYDGYSALGEAIRMAHRINGKRKILLPEHIYESKLSVVMNYIAGLDLRIEFYKFDHRSGFLDLQDLEGKIDSETSTVVVENPNSLGILDPNVPMVQEIKGEALLIAYVDPISLGMIVPPGAYGADIAVAEGQQLGLHQNFGGPFLGIFSFRKEYARKSPGRLIGRSLDHKGRVAYVMTLQTREQHIRREKATSNICTNQALMAIASLAYLSLLGENGLRKVAGLTLKRSEEIRKALSGINSVNANPFSGTAFSDVAVRFNGSGEKLQQALERDRIWGGIAASDILNHPDDNIKDIYFFSATEKTKKDDIEALRNCLGGL